MAAHCAADALLDLLLKANIADLDVLANTSQDEVTAAVGIEVGSSVHGELPALLDFATAMEGRSIRLAAAEHARAPPKESTVHPTVLLRQ